MQRLIIFLTTLTIISGCESFFEQDVFVELPEHEPKVVINSMINPNDTLIRILVTKSIAIDSREESGVALKDADVVLQVNGSPLSDIVYDTSFNYFVSEYQPQPGDTYEIEVEAPGLPAARSATYLPKEVLLTNATFAGTRYDIDGWEYQAIKFTLRDIPNEANYYEVFLYIEEVWEDDSGEMHFYRYEVSYLESPISFLTYTDRGLAFTDASFENSSIELEVWTDYYFGSDFSDDSGRKLLIGVRSATESYYEYMTTFYIHEWNQYPDLFSGEPVPMYSNIEGGYGIFSAYTTSEMEIAEE